MTEKNRKFSDRWFGIPIHLFLGMSLFDVMTNDWLDNMGFAGYCLLISYAFAYVFFWVYEYFEVR